MGVDNEARKQRIQNAFQDGGNNVEKLPAREDFSPEQLAATEVRVAPYCRVSTLSEMRCSGSITWTMCPNTPTGPWFGSMRMRESLPLP